MGDYLKEELYQLIKEDNHVFDFIQEASLDGIWYWDLENPEFEWMSPKFWECLGYEPSEKKHLVSEWQSLIDPKDFEEAKERIQRHFKDPSKPYDQIVKYRHKNGSFVWVRCRGMALKNAQGQLTRMFGAHNNVTELVKQREQAKQSEMRLKRAQVVARIGSWEMVLSDKVQLVWSDEVFNIIEKDPQYFKPTPEAFLNIVHPEDRERLLDVFQKSAYQFQPYRVEFRVVLDSGETKWVREVGEFEYDENQNPLTLYATIQDITEQKRIEFALAHSQEVAEEANKAKSEFLANMSHELRTPLTAIMGLTDLALRDKSLEKILDRLEKIKESGKFLLKIISETLDLARIEAKEVVEKKHFFSVASLAERIDSLFSAEVENKAIKINYALDPNLPSELYGDEIHLTQVLMNLVSNAVKYTEEGFINLEIDLLEDTDNQFCVGFLVKDTGIGIPEVEVEKVKQPFFQSINSSINHLGTGLGLAIASQLVEVMGGELHIESELGHGTSVRFSILFDKPQQDQQIRLMPERLPDKQSALKYTVLLAEDNDLNREVLKEVIKGLGLNVLEASNGFEVIDLSTKEDFDLILLDIKMPIMDGHQVIKYLKKDIQFSKPVVVLSAAVLTTEIDMAIKLGADDFLAKPIDVEALKKMFNKWLGIRL